MLEESEIELWFRGPSHLCSGLPLCPGAAGLGKLALHSQTKEVIGGGLLETHRARRAPESAGRNWRVRSQANLVP